MLHRSPSARSIVAVLLFAAAFTAVPALAAVGPDPEPAAKPAAAVSRAEPAPIVLRGTPSADAASSSARPEEARSLGRPPAETKPIAARDAQAGATSGISRTTLSLAAVLGLIFVIGVIVKRLPRNGMLGAALTAAGRAPSGVVEVLGRFTLSRGVTLILLKVDRRVLLLSQCGQRAGARISPLLELTEADDIASIVAKCRGETGDTLASRFESTLGRADSAIISARPAPAPPRRPSPPAVATPTQVSEALRARLAAMRAAAPVARKAAA